MKKAVILILACAGALCVTGVFAVLYLSGKWIPNFPPVAVYPVRGIDVSHHQRNIRWNAVAASGIRFAYIKATEGGDYADPNFKVNWDESAAAGIKRGAYHFYSFEKPGKMQALHFIAAVPADASSLPPAVDVEFSGSSNQLIESISAFQHELSEYLTVVAKHYGRRPVIYADRDFEKQYLRSVAADRSLWLAEIFFSLPSSHTSDWTFWQFTGKGRVPGIKGFVDMDVFAGSESDFDAFLRAVPTAIPAP